MRAALLVLAILLMALPAAIAQDDLVALPALDLQVPLGAPAAPSLPPVGAGLPTTDAIALDPSAIGVLPINLSLVGTLAPLLPNLPIGAQSEAWNPGAKSWGPVLTQGWIPLPAGPPETGPSPGAPSESLPLPPQEPQPPPPEPPSVEALSAGVVQPIEASPTVAAFALGVTALFAVGARLYSRLDRDALEKNGPRARICELLGEHPGATVPELMAWTGLGRGAVVHHAQMLQRHGILMSQHDGLHRRLFLVGPRLPPIERAPTPAELRVLDALRARGPLTQAELARELGVTLQAANYHLVRLRREARVEGQGPEGATRWSAAPLTPPDISALPGLAPR